MDLDSVLIIVSMVGLMMAPFWSKWWNLALKNAVVSRHQRIAGVLLLSLATLLVVHVGPWVLMAIMHGTITANLADPMLPFGLTIMFGPSVAIQIIVALTLSLPREEISN